MSESSIGEQPNKKILNMTSIVQKTMSSLNEYKKMGLFSNSDYNRAHETLREIYLKIESTKHHSIEYDISAIISNYGTRCIEDMISMCFKTNYMDDNIISLDPSSRDKFDLIRKYAKPFGFKIVKTTLDSNMLDMFDLSRTSQMFSAKVYGIKIAFPCKNEDKTYVVSCIVDDIMVECADSKFLKDKLAKLTTEPPNDVISYNNFISYLTIKDLLANTINEVKNKYTGYYAQTKIIKHTPISQIVKDFITFDPYNKRLILIQLLMRSHEQDFKYLAHLLFQLMSNETETMEQTMILDSLPWRCKCDFQSAMTYAINYSNNLSNYDSQTIPFEQQICLMKVPDHVKEKAMIKLNEIKMKSDETSSKSRHYLDGLLKIPFGVYKEESVLNKTTECIDVFFDVIKIFHDDFPIKSKYASLEVRKFSQMILDKHAEILKHELTNCSRKILINNARLINNECVSPKISYSKEKTCVITQYIDEFISNNKNDLLEIAKRCSCKQSIIEQLALLENTVGVITKNFLFIEDYARNARHILDNSVYGHGDAKRQIERIIGQWINGDNCGYCFGFEGPPGVGKTSLAKKGIAQCLKDRDGVTRPFAFIAIGGASNSSTLDGHNYTYAGSTWGRIVDILIESKCMNPIFFIDELDKVSKTENGREIIGILTHLIDSTQNTAFQDKYFSGIDIDLSKALFIFSYNDVDEIDKILLDRIHRIKFDSLTQPDKLTITRNHLIPEILLKMGLTGMVDIGDKVVSYIIQKYTSESGVRKLKEILFEIVGEINLSVLQNSKTAGYSIPIIVTIDDIVNKYLKERREITVNMIHSDPKIGVVSGLWANSKGCGGILPIECSWMPSNNFLEMKLTGLQGDVMKESMYVAKTLAYKLADEYTAIQTIKGIHIHVPEGATPKDGPSAGAAITTAIYSLITNRLIKHDVAITGEICLQGKLLAIGSLDLKILGGIAAGVKTFIYPKDNSKDYEAFIKIHTTNEDITFISASTIQDVFDNVFC